MGEYKENIRHSCGHVREIVTLGARLPRRQVKAMQLNLCPSCQLRLLLNPEDGE